MSSLSTAIRQCSRQSISRLRTSGRTFAVREISTLNAAKAAWNERLIISEEVEHALEKQEPIVALESTIITHGMPYPTNLSTSLSLESILREQNVIPATIALLDGNVHIGLTSPQLERLADTESGEHKVKVSRRDIAPSLATGVVGGTTVAGTMYVASTVGIGCFVTGGIGGVHRGAESSMDVSADLIELGRTPMAVICAGAKSILDIPRTLEVLETQGVCVATYGETLDFPAFYTPSSGMKSPWSVDNPLVAAELIYSGLSLPRPLSTLLAVPIPSIHSAKGEIVQNAVEKAVLESVQQGVDKRGKEVTPWLLRRVGELTGGTALELNVKLIENNARVGASVAVELARLQRNSATASASAGSLSSLSSHASSSTSYSVPSTPILPISSGTTSLSQPGDATHTPLAPPRVIVVGAAALDLTSSTAVPLSPRSTTPGQIFLTPGGVGRNIAEAAQNLLPGSTVQLVSALGRDSNESGMEADIGSDAVGKILLMEMGRAGLRTDGIVYKENQRSAACSLVLEKDGDLAAGVADMDIVESLTEDAVVRSIEDSKPELVVFDLNSKPSVISRIIEVSQKAGIPTLSDPTSVPKLARLIPALVNLLPPDHTFPRPLTHFSPNLIELTAFHEALISDLLSDKTKDLSWEYINALNLTADFRAKLDVWCGRSGSGREWIRREGVVQKMIACLPFVQSFWVKAGKEGLIHLALVQEVEVDGAAGDGALYYRLEGARRGTVLKIVHYPAFSIPDEEIVSTTGAGDTLVGGIVAGLIKGGAESDWVAEALQRVERTMRSRRAVG